MDLLRSVNQNTKVGRVFFVINKKVEVEAKSVIMILPLIFEKIKGKSMDMVHKRSHRSSSRIYLGQKDGVIAEEDETLRATFQLGKLGLMEEEIGDEKLVIKQGIGKLRFDTAIRISDNPGNREESLGTANTCSSVLSEDRQKRKKIRRKNREKKVTKKHK